MSFTPTAEQSAIVEAVKTKPDNIIVHALAGAAKTSTLVLIAKALPSTPMLCLAFNKKIQVEMKERLPPHCEAMTLNSIGHRVWSQAIGRRLVIEPSKTYNIVKELINELTDDQKKEGFEIMADVIRAVDAGKTAGYLPTGKFSTAKPLMTDDEFFAWLDEPPSELMEDLIREATIRSVNQAMQGICDFNDQILMPTVFFGVFPSYPLVLIDEAQDLSALNHVMLRKIVRKRLIAVGDPCQPLGTSITKIIKKGDRWNEPKLKQVPIEDIKVGDKLLGHNANGSFMYNRRVEGITRRPFNGNLIVVGPTRYTPNHHCYTRFASLAEHWCVYLMRKGSAFRVGKARMSYGEQGLGPQIRAKAENADALWILATYAEEEAAFIAEAIIQTEFGLSDLCFIDPFRPWLQSFWLEMQTLDLETRAKACLTAYNREYSYPLWQKGDSIPAKRPFITKACNLLDGCEFIEYEGSKLTGKDSWKPFSITYEPYSGDVISFTVSDNHLYVADGIVTHNCQSIYGFRGAHEDSMTLLADTFDMMRMDLTVTFRCPQAVVREARWRAPAMAFPDWAKEGSINQLNEWRTDTLPPNSVILCRNNAPLFNCAITLLKNGLYPELIGNDIGKALIKIMKKLGPEEMPTAEALVALESWKAEKLAKARNPSSIVDQAECIEIFLLEVGTLGHAILYAENLLARSGNIKLMTGHKSKGLEFDDVFILNRDLIRMNSAQDKNLFYVMQTRAKNSLSYISMEGFKP